MAGEFFERVDGVLGWFRGTPVHVTSDNVNLRSRAGTGNSVIGSFNTGTNAIVNDGPRNANGYAWYNIVIDGLTGWMASDFLAEGHVGHPGPGDAFPIGAYVMTTTDLNLRSGPGTSNSIVRVYGDNETATVLDGPQSGGGHAWYKVEIWSDSKTGWFAGEFLERARLEPTGARHRINDGPLNLRDAPGLRGRIITAMETGTIVVIEDASFVAADGYTWMNVSIEQNRAFVGWIAQGFSSEM